MLILEKILLFQKIADVVLLYCNHFDGNYLKHEAIDLLVIKTEVNLKVNTIEKFIKVLRDQVLNNTLFNKFKNVSLLTELECQRTIGFSKEEFVYILTFLKNMNDSPNRTISQTLAVYL